MPKIKSNGLRKEDDRGMKRNEEFKNQFYAQEEMYLCFYSKGFSSCCN